MLAGLWTADSRCENDSNPKFVTKSIEDIQVGDFVLARDEFANEIGMRRVVEVYRRTCDHLRILTFRAKDGSQQTLETTDEHPFWVVGENTFTEAKDLQAGDQVTSPHGELQTLLATRYEPKPEGVAVFNFQVEGYHTYYVREHGTRGPPVLVHNANYEKKPRKLSDKNPVPKTIREQYEEIRLGNGVPRLDAHGNQKVFSAGELKAKTGGRRNVWEGSLEWDVPGTNNRILQRPDGQLGYVVGHDYAHPKLFPGPWYPEGGKP